MLEGRFFCSSQTNLRGSCTDKPVTNLSTRSVRALELVPVLVRCAQTCEMADVITTRLILRVLNDERMLIEWLMNVGIIASMRVCDKCGKNMRLCKRNSVNDKYMWRCKTRGEGMHDTRVSVRKNSWFESSHLSMNDILYVTHLWCMKMSNKCIMTDVKLAKQTVVDWRSFCREVCMVMCERENEMLGGEGVIVEIDESKFGKRKYQRGRRVDEKWVFGGVERGTDKCFMKVVPERSKNVLLNVIQEFIRPGSTIVSDCWRSYDCLQDEGFVQLAVNHSLHLKDPETGGHTNSIEGTWSAVKRGLNTSHGNLDEHLFEYIWRRKHKKDPDLTRSFLESVRTVYPPND